MEITDRHLDVFELPSPKSKNDENAKLREELYCAIVSREYGVPYFRGKAVGEYEILPEVANSAKYKRIRDRVCRSVETLLTHQGSPGISVRSIVKKGGRSKNFDVELWVSDHHTERPLAIELKRGVSIYKQPEFCQYYVTKDEFQLPNFPNYAEFHFDQGFVDATSRFVQLTIPSRSDYLREIPRIKSELGFFKELRSLNKTNESVAAFLKKCSFQSIHKYLCLVGDQLPSSLPWESLKNEFGKQIPKNFLSINERHDEYLWERFRPDDLEPVGMASLKERPSGLYSSIILPTLGGAEIVMLLRWKNGAGILGPAFQISMAP